MPFCVRCGAGLQSDARFCPQCGMALEKPSITKERAIEALRLQVRPRDAVYHPTTTFSKGARRVLAILGGIVLVITLTLLTSIDDRQSPQYRKQINTTSAECLGNGVCVGATTEDVGAKWGYPTTMGFKSDSVVWLYGVPDPSKDITLYFQNDKLVRFRVGKPDEDDNLIQLQ